MLAILLLSVAFVLAGVPRQSQRPSPCEVRGAVTDAKLIGINNAQVEFTNGQVRLIEHVNTSGTFSLSVPPGRYSLNVTANGFCPYTANVLLTQDGANGPLNIALLECSDCPPMSIDFVEPPVESGVPPPKPIDTHDWAFKYKQESLESGESGGLSPSSVRFGRRRDLGDTIEYTGLDCPGFRKPPTLLYSGGSLSATKLIFVKQMDSIRAEGNVTVADRRGVNHGSIVQINLAVHDPLAVITK